MHKTYSILAIILIGCLLSVPVSAQGKKTIPLLVIGMEFPLTSTNPGDPHFRDGHREFPASVIQIQPDVFGTRRTFQPTVSDRIFGADTSLDDYYEKNSYGAVTFVSAGVFGPYPARKNASHYWDELWNECLKPSCSRQDWYSRPECRDCRDLDKDGWTDGFEEKGSEAIHTFIDEEIVRRNSFNLTRYDTNHDGRVTRDELVVVVAYPQAVARGFVRGYSPAPDSKEPFTVGNIQWDLWGGGEGVVEYYNFDFGVSNPHANRDLGALAHEIAHVIIDAGDEYETFNDPAAPGPFSLMDTDAVHSHLDPLHKIRAGWLDPIPVTRDGYYQIRSVEAAPDVYKLFDPASHPGEYFLVENRQRTIASGPTWDQRLPSDGLAIWHINESVPQDYRKEIGIEPEGGIIQTPINYSTYLWSHNFAGFSDSSFGVTSRWKDGSPSRIGVRAISISNETMEAFFDVPGPGLFLDIFPPDPPAARGTKGVYTIRLENTGPVQDTFTVDVTGLEPDRYTLGATSVSLAPYQPQFIPLEISHPKCPVHEPITITGTSLTNNQVRTTREFTLTTVPPPRRNLLPDRFEPNDDTPGATPVIIPADSPSSRLDMLTLSWDRHQDLDYFKISYPSPETLGCGLAKQGGYGPLEVRDGEGGIFLAFEEEYCRPVDIEVYSSELKRFDKISAEGVDHLKIPCAALALSPDETIYLSVHDHTNIGMRYNLSLMYGQGVGRVLEQEADPGILVNRREGDEALVQRPDLIGNLVRSLIALPASLVSLVSPQSQSSPSIQTFQVVQTSPTTIPPVRTADAVRTVRAVTPLSRDEVPEQETTVPQPACRAGYISCNGICVDPLTDPAHCGACALACQPPASCRDGVCTAVTVQQTKPPATVTRAEVNCGILGKTNCGGACIDLRTDWNNCGSCGRACPTGNTCETGRCCMPMIHPLTHTVTKVCE